MTQRPFPQILCTGGLEGVAGAMLALDDSRMQLPGDAVYVDCAGCIDAPQSMPSGALFDGPNSTQVYLVRD